MTNREMAEAFTERFGRSITLGKIGAYASRHRLRKTQEARSRSHKTGRYTEEHIAWVRDNVPGHRYDEIAPLWEKEFGAPITKASLRHLMKAADVRQGIHCGWPLGHEPHNKGRKWDEWMSEEGQRTIRDGQQFKPGHPAQNAIHKILDIRDDPHTGPMVYLKARNVRRCCDMWVPLGKFEWMLANGRDWPEGHKLVHADRNRWNNDPENLFAVPNRIYPLITSGCRGAGIRYHDRETLEVAIAHAQLTVRRKEIERTAPRRCTKCGTTFVPPDEQRAYADRIRLCPDCAGRRKKRRNA